MSSMQAPKPPPGPPLPDGRPRPAGGPVDGGMRVDPAARGGAARGSRRCLQTGQRPNQAEHFCSFSSSASPTRHEPPPVARRARAPPRPAIPEALLGREGPGNRAQRPPAHRTCAARPRHQGPPGPVSRATPSSAPEVSPRRRERSPHGAGSRRPSHPRPAMDAVLKRARLACPAPRENFAGNDKFAHTPRRRAGGRSAGRGSAAGGRPAGARRRRAGQGPAAGAPPHPLPSAPPVLPNVVPDALKSPIPH